MKLLLAFVTALAFTPAGWAAEEKPLKDRAAETAGTIKRETREAADAATKAIREGWKTTKSYLSQDPSEFREGASRKLDELAADLDALKARSAKATPMARGYFETRLKALREHLQYARAELTKFPGDKNQSDYEAARKHFNQTIEHLEKALDQAEEEARDSA